MNASPAPGRTRRGRRLPWVLLVLFVVMPIVELYVLIQVGQVIGAWWTIALLVLASVVGGWLIRREGSRAWAALRTTLQSGRMPAREIADGALVLLGGTLMLSPGFVTDVFALLLILPFTRPFFRGLLTSAISRRLVVVGPGFPGAPGAGPRNGRHPGPDVVQGDVVDDGD